MFGDDPAAGDLKTGFERPRLGLFVPRADSHTRSKLLSSSKLLELNQQGRQAA